MAAFLPYSDAVPLVGASATPPHSTPYALFVPAPSAPRLSCEEVEVAEGWRVERLVPPTTGNILDHQIGASAAGWVSTSNLKFNV
jgi:hypothetical protein